MERSSFGIHPRLAGKYLSLGICSFLSQISLVAAMAAIQNMTLKYGALDPIFGQSQYAQIPMAVLGIVMKFFQIVISVAVGMAAGCIPIVGYNIGAGRKDRASDLFTRLLICEAAVGAAALFIVELFPRQLIGIFGAANESSYYTDFAVKCFRIYLCMMILATVNKATFIYLQSFRQSSFIHDAFHGAGSGFWCWLCTDPSNIFWLRRGTVFDAGVGRPYIYHIRNSHRIHLQNIESCIGETGGKI